MKKKQAKGPAVRRCADCRDGEHSNYDEDIVLVTVGDGHGQCLIKRCYMCRDHRDQYADDGYYLYVNGCRIDCND